MTHRFHHYAGLIIILLFLAGTMSGLAASSEQLYYGGLAGYLKLPSSNVNLGPLKVDPSDSSGRRVYFQANNAMTITYQCYWGLLVNWVVQISGDNFKSSGGDIIPITQMQWKSSSSNFKNMPTQGSWDNIDQSTNYKNSADKFAVHNIPLSLYLPLTNDEFAGTYQGTFYATLIFY